MEVIDRKIAEHQAALERYQTLRRTLVGKQPRKAREPKESPETADSSDSKGGRGYVARDWREEVERIREYLKAHGPSKPAMIGGSVGLTPVAVGIAIKSTNGIFDKDGYGRVILVG